MFKNKFTLPAVLIALMFMLGGLAACGGEETAEGPVSEERSLQTESSETAAPVEKDAMDMPKGDPAQGETVYEQTCSSCHGSEGTGGHAPSHVDCGMCNDYSELFRKIENTMPHGEPGKCTGECSANTAAYIYVELNGNSF